MSVNLLGQCACKLTLFLGFRIHQYFDGKCSDDEILYRAEITRKQLREVLHHYEEYVRSAIVHVRNPSLTIPQLQTFLHPS